MTEANGGDAAERLNRYWDDLLRDRAVHPGGPAVPTAGLDPDLAAAVRRLHALDNAPAPDPALAARLWPALVPPAADAATGDASPVTAGARSLRLVHPALGRPLVEMIAAALLLAVLGGSLDGRGVFPSLSGPVPTAAAQETTATAAATACLPSPTPWADSLHAPLGLADARPTPASATTQRGCE